MTDIDHRRFRWADLQIQRLRRCRDAADLHHTLSTLPKSLEETYHQALETIPDVYRRRVVKLLVWLTSSFRELTSSEVVAFVGFPTIEDVLNICTSVLITMVDMNDQKVIKLTHFTVKEFLRLDGREASPRH